jgi:hypothetical protein
VAFVEAFELSANLSVNQFGGSTHLGFVLLFQQFELLLLRNGNALFQRCKDLKDKNVSVNQSRPRLIQQSLLECCTYDVMILLSQISLIFQKLLPQKAQPLVN